MTQTKVNMNVSIDKSTVHRVVHCMQSYIRSTVRSGAPLLELSWYLFSKYTNFVAGVNLASSLLHKSRREIRKNEALRTNKQNPEVTELTLTYGTSTPTHPRTN